MSVLTLGKRRSIAAIVMVSGALLSTGAAQSGTGSVIGTTTGQANGIVGGERLQNLGALKETLLQYHDCTCTCGCYTAELDSVTREAGAFFDNYVSTALTGDHLDKRTGRKPVVVIDIDETALSNWEIIKDRDFGYSRESFLQWEQAAKAPGIPGTLRLFNAVKAQGLPAVFLTARLESERDVTVGDLRAAGYAEWDGLIMKGADAPALAADYKSQQRAALREKGFIVVINIGDQASDLSGEPALGRFKLPNPFYLVR
jgi:hypothetical protein